MKIVMKILIVSILFFNVGFASEIHEVAKKGNLNRIKEILNKEPGMINVVDERGYTPLHWSLIRAKWESANYLILDGAEVNIQGTEGGTPLHCAANHDNAGIIRLLIQKGAKTDLRNLWGNTPLCLAVERGCVNSVKCLVECGADVNSRSNEGWTPLHYAYMSGYPEIQKLLISKGAGENLKDQFGKVPSDYRAVRPSEIKIKPEVLNQYSGIYHFGGETYMNIYIDNDKLMFEEFALDELYPISTDEFYNRQEPWKVRFYRNFNGIIDRVAVDFLRLTVIGKKVKSVSEQAERRRLGVKIESLSKGKLPNETMEKLFFDLKLTPYAQLVTFVQEGSPAAAGGLKVNDIIIEFYNKKLLLPGDLQSCLYDIPSGIDIPVSIIRNGIVETIIIKFTD